MPNFRPSSKITQSSYKMQVTLGRKRVNAQYDLTTRKTILQQICPIIHLFNQVNKKLILKSNSLESNPISRSDVVQKTDQASTEAFFSESISACVSSPTWDSRELSEIQSIDDHEQTQHRSPNEAIQALLLKCLLLILLYNQDKSVTQFVVAYSWAIVGDLQKCQHKLKTNNVK